MNKTLVLIIIIAVVIVGGYFLFARGGNYGTGNSPSATPAPQGPADQVIEITATGFSPSNVTIKAGQSVEWINKDASPHWPASAMHPTHEVYPGSTITKCGTAEQLNIFDACRGLDAEKSFRFKFDRQGTWQYHDHLNPRTPFFGSITVE